MEHTKGYRNGQSKEIEKTSNDLTNHHKTKTKIQLHILNIVVKPSMAYTYYAVPFSKPNIEKIHKILNKLTKQTYSIPKSTTNILTQLSTIDFGINITFSFPDYVNYIGQHLVTTLNDQAN